MKVAHLSERAEDHVTFSDGLGVRVRALSEAGEPVQRFTLHEAFAPVQQAVQERVTRLTNLHHVKFARIRGFEKAGKNGGAPVVIMSDVEGRRLSDVLLFAGHGLVTFDSGPALQVTREVLAALTVLHDSRNVTHGSLGPERVILTPHGRVVVVEHMLSLALDKLQLPRHQLWRDWRIATPPAAGPVRFDARTDLAQVGLLVLALLLGRPLDEDEYPHQLRGLLPQVHNRLGRGTAARIARDVQGWLERMLPIESRHPFTSVKDAQLAFEGLVTSPGTNLGLSPARVKALLHACAVLDVPAYSVPPQDEGTAPDASPSTVVVHTDVAPPGSGAVTPIAANGAVEIPAVETPDTEASERDEALDIEALLRLAAELDAASEPETAAPAPQLPLAAVPEFEIVSDVPQAEPTADDVSALLPQPPVARALDEPLPDALVALATERVELHQRFADLLAQVAPEPVPEEAPPSASLVLNRVRWSFEPNEGQPPADPVVSAGLEPERVTSFEWLVGPVAEPRRIEEADVAAQAAPTAEEQCVVAPEPIEMLAAPTWDVDAIADLPAAAGDTADELATPLADEPATEETPEAHWLPETNDLEAVPAVVDAAIAGADIALQAEPAAAAEPASAVVGSEAPPWTVDAIAPLSPARAPEVAETPEAHTLPDLPGHTAEAESTDIEAALATTAVEAEAPTCIVDAIGDPPAADGDVPDEPAGPMTDEPVTALARLSTAWTPEVGETPEAHWLPDIPGPAVEGESTDIEAAGAVAWFVAPAAAPVSADPVVTDPGAAEAAPATAAVEADALTWAIDAIGDPPAAPEDAPGELAGPMADDPATAVASLFPPQTPDTSEAHSLPETNDLAAGVPADEPQRLDEAATIVDVPDAGEASTELTHMALQAAPATAAVEADAPAWAVDTIGDPPAAAGDAPDELAGPVADEPATAAADVQRLAVPEPIETPEPLDVPAAAPPARTSPRRRRRSRQRRPAAAVEPVVAHSEPRPVVVPSPARGQAASLVDRDVPAWQPPTDLRSVVAQAALRASSAPPAPVSPEPMPAAPLISTALVPAAVSPTLTAHALIAQGRRAPEAAGRPLTLVELARASSAAQPAALSGPGFDSDVDASAPPPTGLVGTLVTGLGETVQPAARVEGAPKSRTIVVLTQGVNWRRTVAAALLLGVLESAAFAAAWWWVQPGATGTLVVQTSVQGVEVLIDGKTVGQTPFHDDLRPGRHTLTLRRGGLERNMPVEISLGVVTTQTLSWPDASTGALRVTSAPDGAEVLVGGRVRGRTPLTLDDLPAGRHTLEVRSEAGTVSVPASVVAGETVSLDVPIFAGWVEVLAPVDLAVAVNGTQVGSSLDGQILLSPGTHRVVVSSKALGFQTSMNATVEPGKVRRLTVTLPTVPLDVAGEEGAEVFVDGTLRGTLPDPGVTVPLGTHEIVLRRPDGTERRRTLTVRAGAPVTLN